MGLAGENRRRYLWACVIPALMAVPYVKWAAWYRGDDFLITLRYGRNAANGLGAVFNEGVRWLGFTSPLHFILSSLLSFLGFGLEGVPAAVSLLGLLGIIAFAINVAWWVDRSLSLSGLITAGALVLSGNLLMVHVGFDSVLALGLAATAVSFFTARRYGIAGVFIGLAVLTRHDTALLAVILVGLLLAKRNRRGLRNLVLPLVALALPWYLFSTLYYGTPIPGTLFAKVEQGRSALLREDFGSAVLHSFRYFPFDRGNGRFILLALLGVTFGGMLRAERADRGTRGKSSARRLSDLCLHPVFIFASFAVLHSAAYFALLRVPPSFNWYHAYLTGASFAVLALGAVRLAALGETRLRKDLRLGHVSWKSIPVLVLTAGILFTSLRLWRDNYREHIPWDDLGGYRYAGYRAAAEYINARSNPGDVVLAGEIGVLGWYCPLTIEDTAALVMPKQEDSERRFRYAVWFDDGRFPLEKATRRSGCELIARFPNPHEVDVLLYERGPPGAAAGGKDERSDSLAAMGSEHTTRSGIE